MSASKRRRTTVGRKDPSSTIGVLGERETLKPVGNADIPSDARICNVHIIGDDEHELSHMFATGIGKQRYGDVFEYQLPEYYQDPLTREAMIPPDKMLPTNEIYDVDFDGYAKTPDLGTALVYDETISESTTGWDVAKGKSIVERQGAIAGNTVVVKPTSLLYPNNVRMALTTNSPKAMFLYVVGKGKQKVLGEWIKRYSCLQNVSAPQEPGELVHVDSWLFDRFCSEVKPIWAKLFMPTVTDLSLQMMMKVGNLDPQIVPVPENSIRHSGFEWKTREFHRMQDFGGQLTATDSYARKLLIGCMGLCSMDIFHFARFRIYYKPTKVQADTLYFQSQQEFVFEQFRGDRHEYGDPSWKEKANEPGTTEQLKDAQFNGVVTCQEGTISYFKDGVVYAMDAASNVLIDDSETGHWY